MSQSSALIDTLKQALKNRHLTYAGVAKGLGMSEANVKRMFASKRFSLERLEQVCQLMQMELSDLFVLHEQSVQQITHFTLEQEQELVEDTRFLMIAVAVRNRFSFEELLEEYEISETECIHYLAKLDRLKLIDLLPNNRIKLRISDDFRWLPNGPIEKFIQTRVLQQFLKSRFNNEMEKRMYLFAMLSDTSVQILLSKMRQLEKEFNELLRQDSKLPLKSRQAVGFFLAMRPWEADVFKPYTRS